MHFYGAPDMHFHGLASFAAPLIHQPAAVIAVAAATALASGVVIRRRAARARR